MLYDKLKKHSENDIYPMHMPGHKRNAEYMPAGLPYDIDITEIHGFDDLHDPQPDGVLAETARFAAELYGSKKSYMLVNGSTVGILAAIGAHVKPGDRILAVEGCHRSIPNAAELFGLEIVYITPETDNASGVAYSVTPEAVDSALKNNHDIKLAVVTSPTYEGVISDVRIIAGIVHEHNIPLLVDSAHGAHLGFNKSFPQNAVGTGADIVVMSLHKTLPALTQCSLLHICGEHADTCGIERMLSILQTSSPSYILMASIDHCLRLLMSKKEKLFDDYMQKLNGFGRDIESLKNLSVLYHGSGGHDPKYFAFDPGKIVIVTKNAGISGKQLAGILRTEHRIELELARDDHAVAMTSISDSAEGFSRLSAALRAVDIDIERLR